MKKFVKIMFSLGLFCSVFSLKIATINAANTESYYTSVNTNSGEALHSSLSKIISANTHDVGYNGLWSAYRTTDCKPGTDIIWDMYSNEQYKCGGSKQGGNYSKEGDSYNREHSIPQSWFNEKSPMKSDLFHVYPTDGYVNNRRSNFPFGETNSPTYTSKNGSKLGKSSFSGYSGTVFEPIDEYKGDFARTYFYMATRYASQVGNWTAGEAQSVFKGSYPYLTTYALNLFTKWSHEDPVSEKETLRNDAVYAIQKNRNPYIDHPEYIDMIWENSYSTPQTVNQAKVDNVISKINTIPTSVTLNDKTNIMNIQAAYNALNSAEKNLVTNYAKLQTAIVELNALENTSTPTPEPDDSDEGDLTVSFVNHGVANNPAYKKDVSFSIGGKDFFASGTYIAGSEDFRIGTNSKNEGNLIDLSKYGLAGKGVSLEQRFETKNAKSFTISFSSGFGTISEWWILFLPTGSSTYSVVSTAEEEINLNSLSETSSLKSLKATLDSSSDGSFVFACIGNFPRIILSSVTISFAEKQVVTNLLANVTVDASIRAKVQNGQIVYENLRFGGRYSKDVFANATSFGVIIIQKNDLGDHSIESQYRGGDVDFFIEDLVRNNCRAVYHDFVNDKAIVGQTGSVSSTGNYYQFAYVITDVKGHEKEEVVAVIYAEIAGKVYFSEEITTSFYDTARYMLNLPNITDGEQNVLDILLSLI